MTHPDPEPDFTLDALGPGLEPLQIDRLSAAVLTPSGQFRMAFDPSGTPIPWILGWKGVASALRQRILSSDGRTVETVFADLRDAMPPEQAYPPRRSFVVGEDVDPRVAKIWARERRAQEAARKRPLERARQAYEIAFTLAFQQCRVLAFRGDLAPVQPIPPGAWVHARLPVPRAQHEVAGAAARFLICADIQEALEDVTAQSSRGGGPRNRVDLSKEREMAAWFRTELAPGPVLTKAESRKRLQQAFGPVGENAFKRIWSEAAPEVWRAQGPKNKMASGR
ncbi:MAG: hypothetical protein AAGI34_15850 [Pseudomonadota bacterium]